MRLQEWVVCMQSCIASTNMVVLESGCMRTDPFSRLQALQDTRAIYLNGCLFDELPSDMVLSVLLQAKNNGAVICFDPGPRCDI